MTAASPYTYTKGSSPVWFRRNNKAFASPYTPPSMPTSHRRTIPATAAPSGTVDPIAPQAYDWLLHDADRLDAAAAEKEAQVQRDLSDAAEWRIVAASYRRLAARHAPVSPAQPVREEPEADLSRANPTWQIPADPEPPECGCAFWRGESCERCDVLTPAPSILTPWSPQSVADLAGWGEASTREFPAANGDAR